MRGENEWRKRRAEGKREKEEAAGIRRKKREKERKVVNCGTRRGR